MQDAGTIKDIAVLGGGTAGLLAALTLKKKLPAATVTVVRSPDLGVIGVGEGTNITFPQHVFEYLGMPPRVFHDAVEPTPKLGIRFLWGPRPEFFYPFATELSMRFPELARANAIYWRQEDRWAGPISALMAHDKLFARKPDGQPQWHNAFAYHVENVHLVEGLARLCEMEGVTILDGLVQEAETAENGIAALLLTDGRRVAADFFIDASGFRAELIGKKLGEPFEPFTTSLFCDRAVIGGWERKGEPLRPYTVAETMDAGWAWQIEHAHFINRGYVYSSSFISDDDARAELLRKNPRIDPAKTRVVKFMTGKRRRVWVDNVVAVGNAAGFVEPLEATAIQMITMQAGTLTKALDECLMAPAPPMRDLYNGYISALWDDVRAFLSIHYRFNTRLDTPFWRTCRTEVDLAGAAGLVDYWHEHGPGRMVHGLLIHPASPFGMEGYFTLLAGQNVPIRRHWTPTEAERNVWDQRQKQFGEMARRAFSADEGMRYFREPPAKI